VAIRAAFFLGIVQTICAKLWRQPLQPSPNREEKAQKFAPCYYGDATKKALDFCQWHGGGDSNSTSVVE